MLNTYTSGKSYSLLLYKENKIKIPEKVLMNSPVFRFFYLKIPEKVLIKVLFFRNFYTLGTAKNCIPMCYRKPKVIKRLIKNLLKTSMLMLFPDKESFFRTGKKS